MLTMVVSSDCIKKPKATIHNCQRVLSGGDGSELRQPLGITIVGGLVMSQLLTLYTTPVVYLFFDRLRLRFSRKNSKPVAEL